MRVNAQRATFWLLTLLVGIVMLAPGRVSADGDRHRFKPFDRIVVFGTSLSDPGNAYAFSGCNISAPTYDMAPEDLLVPEADCPYARGGNRFSNGPTWIEDLGRVLGVSRSVRPALAGSSNGASNYAIGGATAAPLSRHHLAIQVDAFLRDFRGRAPADALYVIEMGSNDVRAALQTGNPAIIEQAIGSIAWHIQVLYGAGAKRFLVWNVPNLATTPAVRMLAASAPHLPVLASAYGASVGFRNGLDEALSMLRAALPDIEVVRFDAFVEVNQIVARPEAYGLRDAEAACIMPGVAPFQCRFPDRHLFWDGIHPTRAGHAVAALLAGKALFQGLARDD